MSVAVKEELENMEQLFKATLGKHGGCQQYLLAKYPENSDARTAYLGWLDSVLPPAADVAYTDLVAAKLSPDTHTLMKVRLSQLPFDSYATTKPPPFKSTSILLQDEFYVHGFESACDPLLVYGTADGRVGYVKGMARACTFQAMMSVIYKEHCEMGDIPAKLAQTALTITVRRGSLSADLSAIAFENAKLSSRGAIRTVCYATTIVSSHYSFRPP